MPVRSSGDSKVTFQLAHLGLACLGSALFSLVMLCSHWLGYQETMVERDNITAIIYKFFSFLSPLFCHPGVASKETFTLQKATLPVAAFVGPSVLGVASSGHTRWDCFTFLLI